MIGLIPDEMLAALFQMACYCFAALTLTAAVLFAPKG